ncbi:SH3 domain-containing protein [Amphibacillus sediminis]|uniref:SH3 domain-containing protein n=1 Tax=Amphibacillus sediminis TaxID=360185 RepID=UPI00082B485E|nr:SH3 domain-containing protein [Amphibacillus sediminis]
MKRYIVIKPYTSCYPDPITLKKGDKVYYGKEDTEYPNWIYCKSLITEKEGWVPKQILTSPLEGNISIVKEDYSAHELTVKKQDRLFSQKELNNWLYCRTDDLEWGWIPCEVVRVLDE